MVYLIDTDDINGATTVTDVALVTFYGEELGGRIQPIGRAGDYNADGVPSILSQPGTVSINAIDSTIHLFRALTSKLVEPTLCRGDRNHCVSEWHNGLPW